HESLDRRGQCLGLAGGNEESRFGSHCINVSPDCGRDDGTAGGHCLDERIRKALSQRSQHGNIKDMMQIRLVGPESGEMHAFTDVELRRELFEVVSNFSITDQHQMQSRAPPNQLVHGPEKSYVVLYRCEPFVPMAPRKDSSTDRDSEEFLCVRVEATA